jgi:peptidyl-dipeptidase A
MPSLRSLRRLPRCTAYGAHAAVYPVSAPATLAGLAALALAACSPGGGEGAAVATKVDAKSSPAKAEGKAPDAKPANPAVTPAAAAAFAAEVDGELRRLWVASSQAEWAKQTDITDEHEAAAAAATSAVMAYESEAVKKAASFDSIAAELPADVARQLKLLKLTSTLPAPADATKRDELAGIVARLDGMYGKGKFCREGETGDQCSDLGELSDVLAQEASRKGKRDAARQLEAWSGWHSVAKPMRPLYQRLVELANEGAKEVGYGDVGELWRSRYDMPPAEFDAEVARLWGQVAPLYEALHCHVRAELHEAYGDAVPLDGPIPAHLLGNMWAQDWSNLYGMLEPYPGEASLDVTRALVDKGYDANRMVKLGEAFFVSLGLPPLPATFWERSMFTKPEGKEVVCHASAWDVTYANDLRIKMCIKVDHEDLITIHHELGHDYYFTKYYQLPVLFQNGANDGFHEAIGDAIALSITPGYLKEVGLLDTISTNDKGAVNKQMQDALQKIAFLPFGLLVDRWRWQVFAGTTTPETYNADWWRLREELQGVRAPMPRSEDDFDPGAKYHIPGNTPYARYFLAHVLQFQFHKALCDAAGHTGPLHTCSVYGSKAAGAKLEAMLALGASKPWPDALEVLTGTRQMDAGPLLEYFAPLRTYLDEQNAGRACGWQPKPTP